MAQVHLAVPVTTVLGPVAADLHRAFDPAVPVIEPAFVLGSELLVIGGSRGEDVENNRSVESVGNPRDRRRQITMLRPLALAVDDLPVVGCEAPGDRHHRIEEPVAGRRRKRDLAAPLKRERNSAAEHREVDVVLVDTVAEPFTCRVNGSDPRLVGVTRRHPVEGFRARVPGEHTVGQQARFPGDVVGREDTTGQKIESLFNRQEHRGVSCRLTRSDRQFERGRRHEETMPGRGISEVVGAPVVLCPASPITPREPSAITQHAAAC